MNTELFLEELESYLKTELSDALVRYHLDYYRNYIEMEVEDGKSEFEVIEALGSPRVIGKNIILTQHMNNDTKTVYTQSYDESKEENNKRNLTGNIKKYAIIAAVIFIIVFILALVLRLIFLAFPILLVFIVVSYFINSSGKR